MEFIQAANQEQTYQELDQRLQAEINSDQVEIQQLQDRLKVTMPNEILFPEGGWELNQKGRETLNKMKEGVNPQLPSATGYGEEDPVASNDTPEGRAKNRGIEIVLVAQNQ